MTDTQRLHPQNQASLPDAWRTVLETIEGLGTWLMGMHYNRVFLLTYNEWDVDGADGIALREPRVSGITVKIKHFSLVVLQELLIWRKLDKLLCPILPI